MERGRIESCVNGGVEDQKGEQPCFLSQIPQAQGLCRS